MSMPFVSGEDYSRTTLHASASLHSPKGMGSIAQVPELALKIKINVEFACDFVLEYQLSVPDPCLSTPCDPNALCVRDSLLSGNFSCLCQAPFTVGDGFNCTGIMICTGTANTQ